MSSNRRWDVEEESRAHQHVPPPRTSMQAGRWNKQTSALVLLGVALASSALISYSLLPQEMLAQLEVTMAGLGLLLVGLVQHCAINMAHQRVPRTSMQAASAKLSEDSVSPRPTEMEQSSQAKTISQKGMLVPRDDLVPSALVLLGVAMVSMIALVWYLPQEVMAVVVALLPPLVLVLVVLQPLERVWGARSRHGRGRVVEWGVHEWVLDSGSRIHHTSNPLVVLEDRNLQGLGSVRTERFEFPGVRYVDVAGNPDADDEDTRNVVSVSQLARDHDLVTVFRPKSCHVKEKKTGQIVGKGRLRNGMYMLDYLRISTVSAQYIGDGDGGGGGTGHGGRGSNNGEGDSGMDEGRSGGGGTGATSSRNLQGQGGGGSGGGDGSSENEIQEMNGDNDDEDDIGEIHQETDGNGDDDENNRRGGGGGGPTYGESSSNKAQTSSFLLSRRVACGICLCIATYILFPQYRSRRESGGTILPLDFRWFMFISSVQLVLFFSVMQPTIIRKLAKQTWSQFHGRSRGGEDIKEGTWGDYVQESSQALNRRLFGLSRFDGIRDPTEYWRRQRPAAAGAFTTSTNEEEQRWEGFLVDSGASFHMTWNESILFHYPQDLQNHTNPPTWSCGGIAGCVKITRSGYLNGSGIMLDGVLLAPESQANLVSVGQLSTQYGVEVLMDDARVIVRKAGVQVGGGQMLNNHHYVLQYFQPPKRLFAHGPTPHFRVFGRLPPSE